MEYDLACIDKIIKVVLFLVNFVIWVTGIALVAVGIFVIVDPDTINELQITKLDGNIPADLLDISAYIMIVVGFCLFVIGFFGCFGAIKNSACMLRLYGLILTILLAIQISAGVAATVFYDKLVETFYQTMETFVEKQYDGKDLFSKSWDNLQVNLKCCGADKPSDWNSSEWRSNLPSNATLFVPKSCCSINKKNEIKDEAKCQADYLKIDKLDKSKYIKVKGCSLKIFKEIKGNLTMMVAIAFTLVIVQMLAITFACSLARSVSEFSKTSIAYS